ncbi:Cytochrome c7 c [uncultured archaeon]|nr:Cytochrome c7 c [uncultured archaeon]
MTISKGNSSGVNAKFISVVVICGAIIAISWFHPLITYALEDSPFATSVAPGTPSLKLTTNRLVILDDPSGWDGGAAGITDQGDQWSGESTTIRWYALVMNSSGRGAQGIAVTSQVLFPNGTVAFTKTGITNNFGIAEFGQDMDRWLRFNGSGSEGRYTINAAATVDGTAVTENYDFIYDEWGCGSNPADGCHVSQYWPGGGMPALPASSFAAGSVQDSPYLHAWDNFHSGTGHGNRGGIGTNECLTCHRGYDGENRTHSARVQTTPQYPAGVHAGKMPCTGCHSTFGSSTMPILQCYDCHPVRNNNLSIKRFFQTATSGFSYQPLTDPNIMAHNSGQNISCIQCHNGMHNVSKPYNATGTSNKYTEYQQCTVCHTAYKRHNESASCTVCHSQDAHAIKVFGQNATYVSGTGNTYRGNCTNCHQDSSLLGSLLSQPMAGSHTGSAPQVSRPANHSNDPLAGKKWNPGYWTNGTDGTSQLSSCKYCHGETLHKTIALGRPSLFNGGNLVNADITGGSTWCQQCHWQGAANYSSMVSAFLGDGKIVPPEITGNATYGANKSNPAYFNHSDAGKDDSSCKGCHGSQAAGNDITGFMHNVATGSSGGPDCASCHDTGGSAPRIINFSAFKISVHKDLNNDAKNITILSEPADKACWACHGDGTEPVKHPNNYRTPRECSNDDCHALNQSFKAPMVYSHFKEAFLNSNPANATNYNISAGASCESCHSNSLNAQGTNPNASVSHYASRTGLVDSINCIFCHLDEDNAIKWGNATEINKNTSSLIEMDRNRNKFTAHEGEFVDLGMGYRIKVTGVSTLRGSALLELYKTDMLVDTVSANIPGSYVYEEKRTINNGTSKIPVIVLNMTSVFLSGNESFVQFEGFRTRRTHYENSITSCYLCHFNGGTEKHRYTVIDRKDEYVYFTEVLFNSSDKREFDQQQALQKLAGATPDNSHVDIESAGRKTLHKGETWKLASDFNLIMEDVSENSDSARFLLEAGGERHTDVARTGDTLEYNLEINYLGYTYSNITVFRANVSEIMQPDTVVLTDILAISPGIKKIDDNSTIYGYNTSWLWENSTFERGRIPQDMHSPLLTDGVDGGPQCILCHDVGDMGAHNTINRNAQDTVSRACWACHGDGKEPKGHPATYKEPRGCKSCHVERSVPFFNATYIGDEKHATLEVCSGCHINNIHKLIKFDVIPSIKSVSLSPKEVDEGERTRINATAVAGYYMRIRGAEYYIDSQDRRFPMSASDGSFDEQTEEVTAEINTSGLSPGTHTVHLRAMERNNKWGEEASVTFVVKGKSGVVQGMMAEPAFRITLWAIMGMLALLALIIFLMKRNMHRLPGYTKYGP